MTEGLQEIERLEQRVANLEKNFDDMLRALELTADTNLIMQKNQRITEKQLRVVTRAVGNLLAKAGDSW